MKALGTKLPTDVTDIITAFWTPPTSAHSDLPLKQTVRTLLEKDPIIITDCPDFDISE